MEFAITAVLGALSILLGMMALLFSRDLSKRTDQLVREEDAIAKQMIKDGEVRTNQMIQESKEHTSQFIKDGEVRTSQILQEIRKDSLGSAKSAQESAERTNQMIKEMRESTQQMLERMDERANRTMEFIARTLEQDKRRQLSGVKEEGPEYKPKK